jgi:LysW-gamma-L-lysine carboxypeptidase
MTIVPQTLLKLVEIYSPSGQEAAAVNWLVGQMHALGFTEAYIDKAGNAVGVMGEGKRQVVLLGHIDTVPGEIAVRVDLTPTPPFPLSCQERGNGVPLRAGGGGEVLYGRGSVDAKGPLAAFVDAVATIGPVAGIQFVVIGAIDEERDSIGARHIVDQYQPDFAIIGEPSQWDRVTLGYKGTAWTQVRVRRLMAHSAGQDESVPETVVAIWNRVQAWAAEFNIGRERVFDQVSPTLRAMNSGDNSFEAWASLRIGVRLPTDLSPDEWYVQLEKLANDAEIERQGFPIPAYRAERDTLLVRAFLGGIRAVGGVPGFVVKTGTADLNIVAPVWGCPAVAYGPGDSSLDHTPEEHILLAEYEKAVLVLVEVLRRLGES